jgi:organic hydroperoxide reductase OsmC/OhrA
MLGETTVQLTHEQDYRFRVHFRGSSVPELVTDEPAPLGGGDGPSPTMLLAAAIGSCLGSSLLFCLGKAHIETVDLEADVGLTFGRNQEGRVRIDRIDVRLAPTVAHEDRARIARCLQIFELFCVVTESVRQGIRVNVTIEPEDAAAPEPCRGVDTPTGCACTGEFERRP